MATKEMVPADEVETLIDAAVARAMGKLASALPASGGGTDIREFANAMASAIAQLTDQEVGRAPRLPPEELMKRERAQERMLELMAEHYAAKSAPQYKLRQMLYMGEKRIMPVWIDRDHRQQPTEIVFYGIPNEAMEPMNGPAEEIYREFSTWIGAFGKRDMGAITVTPAGLTVVKGGPAIHEAQHTGAGHIPDHLVPTIVGRGAPGPVVETHILGSLMPPARQNP